MGVSLIRKIVWRVGRVIEGVWITLSVLHVRIFLGGIVVVHGNVRSGEESRGLLYGSVRGR